MSNGVQFDEDQNSMGMRPRNSGFSPAPAAFGQSQVPGMAGWLIKKGIIKTESGAKGFLVGVVFFDFIIAALVIYFFVLR